MKILCLSLIFILSSCASISGSKNQAINLQTTCDGSPISGATCSLTNDSGVWFTKTPAAIFIRRSGGDLVVVCKKDELQAAATFKSSSSSGMWGNILAGGIIGAAVDAGSGAGFDYPNPININFDRCPTPK
jgi:hypothetical protein